MREHDLQPRMRRRYVATTDSDHDQPIFPNRAKDMAVDGPDQLWVADITYVAIATGFVYVAVDSRRLVPPCRRLRDQPVDRRSVDARRSEGRNRQPQTVARMRTSLRSRLAIRRPAYRDALRGARPRRLDGPPRQSLRQRQSGELHEDTQGRSGLSDGLRNLRRCRRETFRASST